MLPHHLPVLALSGGRLSFATGAGRLFDAALAGVEAIEFPWFYVGAGVRLRVGGELYRLSFVLPTDSADPHGPGVLDGRRAGKAWRAALRP